MTVVLEELDESRPDLVDAAHNLLPLAACSARDYWWNRTAQRRARVRF
jgi:hypothetical protein